MILFYLLIIAMPLTRHPLWEQFVGGLNVIKYLGLACLLYALVYLTWRPTRPRLFQTWQARWFVVLTLMGIASFLIKGPSMPWSLSPLMIFLSFLALFFITVIVVDSPSRLRGVLMVAIGSVGLASLYALREWQEGVGVWGMGFRPGWIAGDANYFTLSTLLCMPVAFCLLREPRPQWERVFCWTCLLVAAAAGTLAASRGGLLGLVAAVLFLAWRSDRPWRNIALASTLLLLASLLAPISPIYRFVNPHKGDVQAQESRVALWQAAARMLLTHPLTGVGLGNFGETLPVYSESEKALKYQVAHNTYLELGAELGLPGLLAFVAIIVTSLRSLERVRWRTLRVGPVFLHQTALGIQAGLVAYTVGAFFVSAWWQKFLWLMVFLSICLSYIERMTIRTSAGDAIPRPLPLKR